MILGDPAYCLPDKERGKPGIDYATVNPTRDYGWYLPGNLVLGLGNFGGDGTYPVFGETDADGELLRVTIEFVGPGDDEEEG